MKPGTRRVITAAASRYTSRKIKGQTKAPDTGWQDRAWGFYDTTPEVRFAAQWVSGGMSRATLYAGRRADDGVTIEPVPDGHPAAEIVSQIAGGPEGQAQMLGAFGPHLVVAGEGWIVIRPRDDGTHEWHVLSTQELRTQGQKMIAEIDGDLVEIPPADPESSVQDDSAPIALRVWKPHPRRFLEADSPLRASLGLLEELHLLNAAVSAIARSRLTGRGVLLVPQGTRFPSTPVQGNAEDDLIEVFMEVAETAYREPESAAATVPIILEVPAEAIGEIKRLTFESPFDELALKLRDEAIRRFATGLDVPAEVMLGLGDSNHWSAWALQDEAVTLGVEPPLDTVAHALTTTYLRPLLQADKVQDADRCLVVVDTSNLRVRANRSATALELYNAGAISAAAVRRETGFDEADAPTAEKEAARRRPETPEDDPDAGQEETNLPVDEDQGIPDTLPASAAPGLPAAVLEAVDGLIWTALTLAGDKLRKTPACPRSERARAREIEPARLHTVIRVEHGQVEQWGLLEGAWPRLGEVAGRLGLDAECLTASLDTYCRELIPAGITHSFDQTSGALRTSCLAVAA
ncbi:hypothetical protein [Streptomyces fuscigenes]|uniref:hypothetical protein n=1 Tax=Streptomyces fuscigenes TaxID=1528880 RepID=UPI001F487266|nr:hypothetical protein [Streptomyces fuscigenes]MCF3960270.1 hypothetical protein [Streptomyces fuscigenes]